MILEERLGSVVSPVTVSLDKQFHCLSGTINPNSASLGKVSVELTFCSVSVADAVGKIHEAIISLCTILKEYHLPTNIPGSTRSGCD